MNFIKSLKNIEDEKKVFFIFLAVHLIVWSCTGLIRTVLPADALEGIYWGSFHDLGTPKHPPLFGWIAYFVYSVFKCGFSIYFTSQLFILGGFIYIYKLARNFLDDKKAMLSVIILEGCWVYSYITGYYGFNPDVIMLFSLPAVTYYFYKCISDNKPKYWILLGVIAGLGLLNKYQSVLLILPMFIWAAAFKREVFKNKYFYLSAVLAFLIFLPHIVWLYKYDFYPFLYFDRELTSSSIINHITAPLKFLLMQLGVIGAVLVMYALLKIKQKSPNKFDNQKDKKTVWFLLLFGLMPVMIHVLAGFIKGGTMHPRWGYEFWFLTGIMLFYFFPVSIDKKAYMFLVKCSYCAMALTFLGLGGLLSIEKNYRSRYPVQEVYNDLSVIWSRHSDKPLEYLGGYIEWTLPHAIYIDTRPKVLLDTYGYPDPWIDYEHMKRAGVLLLDRDIDDIIHHAHGLIPYLDKDYPINPKEYRFTVKNAFQQPREYRIYYAVIPPLKTD